MKYKILIIIVIAAIIYLQKSGLNSVSSTQTNKVEYLNSRVYKNNLYFKNLLLDDNLFKSLAKVQTLFQDTPNGEDIAVWVCLGKTSDSSPQYREISNYSFNKINENASLNFSHIERAVKNLSSEDTFERGQLINLVNLMNINKEDKIKFFGGEISRASSDSLNMTAALVMLKNSNASNKDVIPYMRECLRLNTNPAFKNKLLTSFNNCFPGSIAELGEFK